jgi:hypothetical protein
LGVREAVMVGYFSVMEISLQDAATISLLARLWFLVAEVFVFIIGIVLDSELIPKMNKK